MNGIKKLWFLGCAAIVVASCGGNSNKTLGLMSSEAENYADQIVETVAQEVSADDADFGQPTSDISEEQIMSVDKKIIRDGRMGIQVEDLSASKRQIDTLLRRMNGYYASESFYEQSYENRFQLNIRIPSANFDKFIAAIETGGGKVLYKDLYTRDVTEQYTDIEIRLANKRNYLKRYQELVRQAKSVKDVLDIEERIRGLEEEIESAEGRLRFLSNQVAYSTLELSISMPTEYKFTPAPQHKFSERFKAAVMGGWRGMVSFLVGLFYIWPFVIVAGALLFVWLRKRKRKKQ